VIYCQRPVKARLVRKVNRFVCEVDIDGQTFPAHIPNSGRLTELMTPGRSVIVVPAESWKRKTGFTLKSVRFNNRLVCIDSTTPNALAEEMAKSQSEPIFKGYTQVKREVAMGKHRFDLSLAGHAMAPMIVEVKSVTLARGGTAMFPDAPTKRGALHLAALSRHVKEGYRCAIMFMVLRSDADTFRPNTKTDPAFCKALDHARASGVMVIAYRCRVGTRSISPIGPVRVDFD